MVKYGEIWWNIVQYVVIYDSIWQNMIKYGKIYYGITFYKSYNHCITTIKQWVVLLESLQKIDGWDRSGIEWAEKSQLHFFPQPANWFQDSTDWKLKKENMVFDGFNGFQWFSMVFQWFFNGFPNWISYGFLMFFSSQLKGKFQDVDPAPFPAISAALVKTAMDALGGGETSRPLLAMAGVPWFLRLVFTCLKTRRGMMFR